MRAEPIWSQRLAGTRAKQGMLLAGRGRIRHGSRRGSLRIDPRFGAIARLGWAASVAVSIGVVPATAAAQRLRFPTSSEDYAEFYPTAYYDEGGLTDWNCGDHTYSNHHGSDFGGGSWTGMDEGRDITAAAHGWVIAAHDGEFDRCTSGSCPGGGGWGNYVWLRHATGFTTIYGHLAEGSVAVSEGEAVRCGDLLGLMGSSGHSTGPHLHLDVRTISEARIDPFEGPCSSQAHSWWVDQGAYMELPTLDCDEAAPSCEPVELISCGASVSSRNDAAGSTDAIAFWGCEDSLQTGPELAYEFVTDRDETVAVRVTGLTADLDLFVLDGRACDTTGCVAVSSEGNADDENLQFEATAEHVYVIVVDGWDEAQSDFTLTTECDGSLPSSDGGAGGAAGGTGGAVIEGGAGGALPATVAGIPGSDEGGCGCRLAPPRRGRWTLVLAYCLLLAGSVRRRRPRRALRGVFVDARRCYHLTNEETPDVAREALSHRSSLHSGRLRRRRLERGLHRLFDDV